MYINGVFKRCADSKPGILWRNAVNKACLFTQIQFSSQTRCGPIPAWPRAALRTSVVLQGEPRLSLLPYAPYIHLLIITNSRSMGSCCHNPESFWEWVFAFSGSRWSRSLNGIAVPGRSRCLWVMELILRSPRCSAGWKSSQLHVGCCPAVRSSAA